MARREVTEQELALTRKILGELAIALLVVAVPYVIVGLFWADAHSAHLDLLHGPDRIFSYLGEVVAWPVLTISDITLT